MFCSTEIKLSNFWYRQVYIGMTAANEKQMQRLGTLKRTYKTTLSNIESK